MQFWHVYTLGVLASPPPRLLRPWSYTDFTLQHFHATHRFRNTLANLHPNLSVIVVSSADPSLLHLPKRTVDLTSLTYHAVQKGYGQHCLISCDPAIYSTSSQDSDPQRRVAESFSVPTNAVGQRSNSH